MTENSDYSLRLLNGFESPVNTAGAIGEIAAALSESEVTEAFGGSYLELLRHWMGGEPIPQILQELGDDSPSVEQLAKFIEDYFGSRLPWVTSGFLRIAAKRLGLVESLMPLQVRTLPAMIKAGVGFPEAAWAAVAGAASREAAIQIGTHYVSQVESTDNNGVIEGSYSSFLNWLGPLTADDHIHQYGLQVAAFVEDDLPTADNVVHVIL